MTQPITELSKDLIKRFIKKSKDDATLNLGRDNITKAKKDLDNIDKARKKLNEASKDKLTKFITKALDKQMQNYVSGHINRALIQKHKKYINIAQDKIDKKDQDELKKIMGEEEINELSKGLLGRYIKKAKNNLGNDSYKLGYSRKRDIEKTADLQSRSKYINKAVDKLVNHQPKKKIEDDGWTGIANEAENNVTPLSYGRGYIAGMRDKKKGVQREESKEYWKNNPDKDLLYSQGYWHGFKGRKSRFSESIEVNELATKTLKSFVNKTFNVGEKGFYGLPINRPKRYEYLKKAVKKVNRRAENERIKEDEINETWKYLTYSSQEDAKKARDEHFSYRDGNNMGSGNPCRHMGNGKLAYKGEFKGTLPPKKIKEDEAPTNVMGNSSSVSGTGPIDTFDPLLFLKKKKKIITRKKPKEI
jgi:hypothetical protein